MKPIASLYSLKAMGCLFVVLQHVHFAGRGLLSPIISTAVPLFAMISGYFLYRDNMSREEQSALIKKRLYQLLRIILQVNAVYLAYYLIRMLLNENYVFPLKSWTDGLELLLYGDTLNYAFWYMNAYAHSLIILWIVCKKGLERWINYFPFLLIIGIFWGRYLFLFPIENEALENWLLHYSKNCFTVILPFVALGWLMHRHEERLKEVSLKAMCFGLAICIFLSYAEIGMLTIFNCNNHNSLLVFTALSAIHIFALALRIPHLQVPRFVQQVGQYHSGNVYYYHVLVASLFAWASWVFPAIQAFIVFATTLMLSMVLKNKSIPVSQP